MNAHTPHKRDKKAAERERKGSESTTDFREIKYCSSRSGKEKKGLHG